MSLDLCSYGNRLGYNTPQEKQYNSTTERTEYRQDVLLQADSNLRKETGCLGLNSTASHFVVNVFGWSRECRVVEGQEKHESKDVELDETRI